MQHTTGIYFSGDFFARGTIHIPYKHLKKHSATAESAYMLRIAKTEQDIFMFATRSYYHAAGVRPFDRHLSSYGAEHSVKRTTFRS